MLLSDYLGPEYFSRKGIIPIIPREIKLYFMMQQN